MVRYPRDYRWSSHTANAEVEAGALLTPHEQYLALGSTGESRREAYRAPFRAHVDEPVLDEIRQATNGNFALGGQRFQEQIEQMLKRRVTRGQVGRPVEEGGKKAGRPDFF